MFTVNKYLQVFAGVALLGSTALLSSCDGVIYEDLDPCSVNYALRFRWDYNMLFADAFKENVGSVAVYGFDSDTEKLAWVITEKGEALAADGYMMSLNEIKPGSYKVVAWCGLENDGERGESFLVPDLVAGESTLSDLTCRMEREVREDGTHHSSSDLYDLYHGSVENVEIQSVTDPSNKGDHIYTVNLLKDTNSVRIILQQLSGNDIDADKFTYTIEESNGLLNHDNSLLDDETITYHPWQQKNGVASVLTPEESSTRGLANPLYGDIPTRAEGDVKVAIADLTMSRLIADRQSVLTVKNDEGATVARIPLTDYALLVKDRYTREMTDQEYLDRQDNYTLTFFLDANSNWLSASILINSWRVVLGSMDFGK